MNRLSWTWVFGVVLAHVPDCCAEVIAPDLAKINDGRTWKVINGDSNTAVKDGKSMVRLYPKGGNKKGSNTSMALLESLEFANGTIEVDLRGRGNEQASFLGVAFGVADGKTYEAVYFRPFRFQDDDGDSDVAPQVKVGEDAINGAVAVKSAHGAGGVVDRNESDIGRQWIGKRHHVGGIRIGGTRAIGRNAEGLAYEPGTGKHELWLTVGANRACRVRSRLPGRRKPPPCSTRGSRTAPSARRWRPQRNL